MADSICSHATNIALFSKLFSGGYTTDPVQIDTSLNFSSFLVKSI